MEKGKRRQGWVEAGALVRKEVGKVWLVRSEGGGLVGLVRSIDKKFDILTLTKVQVAVFYSF